MAHKQTKTYSLVRAGTSASQGRSLSLPTLAYQQTNRHAVVGAWPHGKKWAVTFPFHIPNIGFNGRLRVFIQRMATVSPTAMRLLGHGRMVKSGHLRFRFISRTLALTVVYAFLSNEWHPFRQQPHGGWSVGRPGLGVIATYPG